MIKDMTLNGYKVVAISHKAHGSNSDWDEMTQGRAIVYRPEGPFGLDRPYVVVALNLAKDDHSDGWAHAICYDVATYDEALHIMAKGVRA
tara:strand:+ start:204 stop:473 length:270 start_codon:yes stop_codon:yes gene_type:complete